MKRLFSVLMVAVVATVAFAFTTPKSSALDTYTYHLEGSSWEIGEGDCEGGDETCQFTFTYPNDNYLDDIQAHLFTNPEPDGPFQFQIPGSNPAQFIEVTVTNKD